MTWETTLNSSETIGLIPGGPLCLAGAIDIYSASRLRDELARALAELPSLTVDMSRVESCDFTTVQLLCSARRSADAQGRHFAVTSVPREVIETCAALGLSLESFGAKRSD